MRIGIADLPLHYGTAPRWLFNRMVKLSKAISEIIILEFGRDEFLRRLSNPFFFQSLSCILGYDWNSSGTTTVTLGALKLAIKPEELGIAVLGGKGKASRKTPKEIEKLSEIFPLTTKNIEKLKYASKMSAKIDNSVLQDGFNLYHHSFIVTEDGKWATVQQGMSNETGYARRYHWLSETVKRFVVEPHEAICCDTRVSKVLNMVAKESEEVRECSVDLVKDDPNHLKKYFVQYWISNQKQRNLLKYLWMSPKHTFEFNHFEILQKLHEIQPKDYEELVATKGVGPKTVRALALLSKLIYGTEPSWRDPVKFTFHVGGKDGIPYPVDRKTYDISIKVLRAALEQAKLNNREKLLAFSRLEKFIS